MATTTAAILDGNLVLATATIDTPEGPFRGGASALDEADAVRRAEGEAVERTTVLAGGPPLVVPTAEANGGHSRHDDLPGGSAPEWVPAHRLGSGEPAWLPADLVLLRWQGSRPLPVQQTSVGSAAHPDPDEAVERGARECLERYAVRRVWSGTSGLVAVTDQVDAALPDPLVGAFDRHGLRVDAWLVADTLPAIVVLVAMTGRQGRITFGAACSATIGDGVAHAVCEAVGMRAALASSDGLRSDFATAGDQVDHALRASAFPETFLAFLRRLEAVASGDGSRAGADGVVAVIPFLHERFGVEPLAIDFGSRDGVAVRKVVVPAADFFVPRHHRAYVLAPGYLE